MDLLKINNVYLKNKRVKYSYEKFGKWNDLLSDDEFFVEYDIDVNDVPNSLLVIPLLCNLLPISWIFDLEIIVDEIDSNFFNCIKDLKNGYQNMFPMIKMNGKINANSIVENKYDSKRTGALFSGGVDAFNTLFQHIDEKPVLLTVWGADIKLDDIEGWNKVKKYHINTANQFDLNNSFVKSNLKSFINYNNLTKYVQKYVNDEWWHGFQHGIGILGLMVPLAYKLKLSTIYIASSFTAEYKGKYTCASDPTIDNFLKFASCNVVHDGYEFNRQDKIKNICDYFDKNKLNNIPIRVCWQSDGGENCCQCEKCTRTILGILAENKNPNQFGFKFDKEKQKILSRNIKKYANIVLVDIYVFKIE